MGALKWILRIAAWILVLLALLVVLAAPAVIGAIFARWSSDPKRKAAADAALKGLGNLPKAAATQPKTGG